jgi:hypothetical protein
MEIIVERGCVYVLEIWRSITDSEAKKVNEDMQ